MTFDAAGMHHMGRSWYPAFRKGPGGTPFLYGGKQIRPSEPIRARRYHVRLSAIHNPQDRIADRWSARFLAVFNGSAMHERNTV